MGEIDPLQSFAWNEADADDDHYRGIITIIAFDESGRPEPMGSGFIIKSEGRRAWAMTAAHVLAGIRNLQVGNQRHSTALDIFLPRPKAVDIDRKRVRAVTRVGDRVDALVITGIAFDEKTDIGLLTLALQADEEPDLHRHEFAATGDVPSVGEVVCMLSFGGLGAHDFKADGDDREFKISIRPVLRIGRVTAVYPDGTRLCRGACIETSIPVFSGMSGGPVFRWTGEVGVLKPFALVTSDPDPDDERKLDRSHAGASIMAILPVEAHPLANGDQYMAFRLTTNDFAGDMDPANLGPSYRPAGRSFLSRYSSWGKFQTRLIVSGPN